MTRNATQETTIRPMELRDGSWVDTVQTFVAPGEVTIIVVPHSEVCMYMRVAGTIMWAQVLTGRRAVQLFNPHHPLEPYSAPITLGEAGFYNDGDQLYTYRVVGTPYSNAERQRRADIRGAVKMLKALEDLGYKHDTTD